MMKRLIAQWLVYLADPLGPRVSRPRRTLNARQASELFSQAELHGVLASVLRGFEFPSNDSLFAAIRADVVARHYTAVGFSLMLRLHAQAIMRMITAAGLRAVIVKGPVFARRIYPDPTLRRFTDIDILIAPEAIPQIEPILVDQGFVLADRGNHVTKSEWKWLHRDNPALMIEVQSNLVHAAGLRAVLSLGYADLAPEGHADEAERPAALLAVAVVHGGSGHHYERLQHVVDVCQAARCLTSVEEERRLELLITRTGARLAAVAGLELAGRLFDEPRCFVLARALGPARYARFTRLLITRSVVTSTMSRTRPIHSWRRLAFRELLKRSRTLSRSSA